ncbi:MAG TPA: VTT domain-containing protein [Myxococcota bacterium]
MRAETLFITAAEATADRRANVWQTSTATKAAVLIDADAYYRVLHDALLNAKSRVLVLGWDLDSRLCLRRDLDEPGRCNATLAAVLKQLCTRGVDVNVLGWDFAPIYALNREPIPDLSPAWNCHKKLRFVLDDMHPVGASHHQKVVVIDDVVAFCGGLDVTGERWDTPAHKIDDPVRHDPPHDPHEPFHDVQLAVQGPIAKVLGDLCRDRWHRATGQRLKPTPPHKASTTIWPTSLQPEFENVSLALSRTLPAFEDHDAVDEVMRLHLDAIAHAQHSIYYENQYLTARVIDEALCASLRKEVGPEIVIVVPETCSGWLEESTIGARRTAMIEHLREADVHGRLQLLTPILTHDDKRPRLNVHGKVTIVDDTHLRIGSANLANRSMGLDSESDLCIEARTEDERAAIRHTRARLLAEHLDVEVADVEAAFATTGSLAATIGGLQGNDRTLIDLPPLAPSVLPEALMPLTAFADPEGPADVDPLVRRDFNGDGTGRRRLRAAVTVVVAALVCVALMLVWRWSPLAELISPDHLNVAVTPYINGPSGPLLGIGGFVVGGAVFFPLTLLILQSSLLFHPLTAIVVSLVGALASTLVMYGVGSLFGAATVQRLVGRKPLQIVRRMGARGVLAFAGFRLAPVAPFSLVNVAAGAARVPLVSFVLGTLLGLLPGVLTLTLVGQGLLAVLWSAFRVNAALPVVVAGLVGCLVAGVVFQRRRRRRQQAEGPPYAERASATRDAEA